MKEGNINVVKPIRYLGSKWIRAAELSRPQIKKEHEIIWKTSKNWNENFVFILNFWMMIWIFWSKKKSIKNIKKTK